MKKSLRINILFT